MANKKIWLGILVIVLVFGITVFGFAINNDEVPSELVGIWFIESTGECIFRIESGWNNKYYFAYAYGNDGFDIEVSNNTAVISAGEYSLGRFDYTIKGDKVIITKVTGNLFGNRLPPLPWTLTKRGIYRNYE